MPGQTCLLFYPQIYWLEWESDRKTFIKNCKESIPLVFTQPTVTSLPLWTAGPLGGDWGRSGHCQARIPGGLSLALFPNYPATWPNPADPTGIVIVW